MLIPTRRNRPPATEDRPATNSLVIAEDNPWWAPNAPEVSLRWWETIPTAYWQGLVDGVALERGRREPEDDAVHRDAVQRAVRIVERAEARDRADRPEAAA